MAAISNVFKKNKTGNGNQLQNRYIYTQQKCIIDLELEKISS